MGYNNRTEGAPSADADSNMGLHEDDARTMIAQENERVRGQRIEWTKHAVELREKRNRIESAIDEMEKDRQDINSAIAVLRAACGVDSKEEWEGFDNSPIFPVPAGLKVRDYH